MIAAQPADNAASEGGTHRSTESAPTTTRALRHRLVAVGLLVAYALIVLIVSHRHEAWYDETDSWLNARDANLPTLFRLTSNVGVPALWFLSLWPTAKTGCSIEAMAITNALFATVAIGILLLAVPLPMWFRALFAFGFYPIYEYGVIARPYALMMLLMFAVAALYRHRLTRSISFGCAIALLANVVVHGTFVAAAMGGVFLFDVADTWRRGKLRKPVHSVVGLGIALIGGVAALWQLWPPANDGQISAYFAVQNPDVLQLTAETLFYFPQHHVETLKAISTGIAALTTLCLCIALIDRPRALFFAAVSYALLAYVYYFKWFTAPRHAGIVLLVLILTLCMARSDAPLLLAGRLNRLAQRAMQATLSLLSLGLIISTWVAAQWLIADYKLPFSDASAMASWMRDHTEPKTVVVGDWFAPTVIAHLPANRRLWLGQHQAFGTYNEWTKSAGERNSFTGAVTVVERAQAKFPSIEPLLLLLSQPLDNPEKFGFTEIHRTNGKPIGYYYEAVNYFLYKRIGPGNPHRESLIGASSAPATPR